MYSEIIYIRNILYCYNNTIMFLSSSKNDNKNVKSNDKGIQNIKCDVL